MRTPATGADELPRDSWLPRLHPFFIFALLFTFVFILHAPLLRLPYFWDEAGYYIPAARDLLLTRSLIPHSSTSNAHPPLVLAWLAMWWKLSGYTPAVTRTAMLLLAAFALLGFFKLAKDVSNFRVAAAATIATALHPVFFTQSSMAHVDLAAAGLSFWGIAMVLEGKRGSAIAFFCLAVLAKETALIVPLAVVLWEFWRWVRNRTTQLPRSTTQPISIALTVVVPATTLALWYGYHYARTGYVFGNPAYFHYNVQSTVHPFRMLLALGKRVWQLTGYMNIFLLTVAAAMAMAFPAQMDRNGKRERIPFNVQALFAVIIAAQVAFYCVIGGAPLARYMLASLPLVILICVSTLWRRMRHWPLIIALACLGFVLAWFVNPPYAFTLEDNLAYRDYVVLHKHAADVVAAHYWRGRVLTAWPATDELSHPYLGYTQDPITVVAVENFSAPELLAASQNGSQFDVALLFSTKYLPSQDIFARFPKWGEWQARFFGGHQDLAPDAAAQLLGGRVMFRESRAGQWVALICMPALRNASFSTRVSAVPAASN